MVMQRTNFPEKKLIILTNDPSLTAWGYAVMDADKNVLTTGCIKTAPQSKKLRIRKGDDLTRRLSEINQELLSVMDAYKVNYLLSELPHGSQNANAAKMIGAVTGIMQLMSDVKGIPIEWYSEGDAKKALLNKVAAAKTETIGAIHSLYKVPWANKKYHDEAVADAIAVYHAAALHSTFLKFYNHRNG